MRDQVNEVLADVGLGAIDGSNDRIGGWQLMFQMLARRRWLIADTCPLLISAIPSRVHDPKKPGDLLKVGGDPLDDAMDAARYGLYSWVTATDKPRHIQVAEVIRPLAQARDLTSAYVRYLQMQDQDEEEDYVRLREPFPMGAPMGRQRKAGPFLGYGRRR